MVWWSDGGVWAIVQEQEQEWSSGQMEGHAQLYKSICMSRSMNGPVQVGTGEDE